MTDLPEVHDRNFERSADHGVVQTLWYPGGSVGVRHVCHRTRDGLTVIAAPRLQLDNGHHIISTDPVTVTPSILCDDCGLHGFITDGVWRGV